MADPKAKQIILTQQYCNIHYTHYTDLFFLMKKLISALIQLLANLSWSLDHHQVGHHHLGSLIEPFGRLRKHNVWQSNASYHSIEHHPLSETWWWGIMLWGCFSAAGSRKFIWIQWKWTVPNTGTLLSLPVISNRDRSSPSRGVKWIL